VGGGDQETHKKYLWTYLKKMVEIKDGGAIRKGYVVLKVRGYCDLEATWKGHLGKTFDRRGLL